jgi:adenylosuccinate synthase
MDSASESAASATKFSALSTQRGIWPTYSDKAARVGIRMADLINPEVFEEKFDLLFELQQKKLRLIYGSEAGLDRDKILADYRRFADLLRPMVCNVSILLHEALESGKKVLFEGAQGAMLDVDHGLYPYTTSSNTTSGSVCTGAGVPPQKINRVVAVVKAYLSRVGGGYLPTELKDSLGDEIRETGGEYGTTTGRARRIGWLDLVQLKMASRINGFTSLAITKIDVLDKLKEIKVCTAYRCKGEILSDMPADLSVYNACEPVYETFPGWETPSSHIRCYEDLPENMRRYIEYLETALKVPVELVSVGPDRHATIVKS